MDPPSRPPSALAASWSMKWLPSYPEAPSLFIYRPDAYRHPHISVLFTTPFEFPGQLVPTLVEVSFTHSAILEKSWPLVSSLLSPVIRIIVVFPSVLSRIGFGIPSTARRFAFNTRSGGVRPGWVRRSRTKEWAKAVGDDQPLQGQVEQDGYLPG